MSTITAREVTVGMTLDMGRHQREYRFRTVAHVDGCADLVEIGYADGGTSVYTDGHRFELVVTRFVVEPTVTYGQWMVLATRADVESADVVFDGTAQACLDWCTGQGAERLGPRLFEMSR